MTAACNEAVLALRRRPPAATEGRPNNRRRTAGWNTTYSSTPPVRPSRPVLYLNGGTNGRTKGTGRGNCHVFLHHFSRNCGSIPFHLSNMNALQRANRARRARHGRDGTWERRGCLPRHARHRRRAGGIRLDVSSEFRQRHTGS